MKIHSLYINKFKGFEDFTINFNNNKTVLVGLNGTGKTTILEILYNAFAFHLEYFLQDKEFQGISIQAEDNAFKYEIEVLINDEKQSDISAKSLKMFLNKEMVNELHLFDRIIYVPTEINFKNYEIKGVMKLEDTEDVNIILNTDKMSRELKQFLINEKYKDLNDISKGNQESANRIQKFQDLYNNFFTDKEFLGIDDENFEPLFKIRGSDDTLKVEQLSSGEKQIFFRGGSLLQNRYENSLVLIDEPEISMHPEWQQKILKFYRGISPNSQFVFATHSPHIVSDCRNDEIKLFEKANNKLVINNNIDNTYGQTTEQLLFSVFGVDTVRNIDIQKDIDEYKALHLNKENLSNEENVRMNDLKEKLTNELDPNDPEIRLLDIEEGTNELKEILKKLGDENNA